VIARWLRDKLAYSQPIPIKNLIGTIRLIIIWYVSSIIFHKLCWTHSQKAMGRQPGQKEMICLHSLFTLLLCIQFPPDLTICSWVSKDAPDPCSSVEALGECQKCGSVQGSPRTFFPLLPASELLAYMIKTHKDFRRDLLTKHCPCKRDQQLPGYAQYHICQIQCLLSLSLWWAPLSSNNK